MQYRSHLIDDGSCRPKGRALREEDGELLNDDDDDEDWEDDDDEDDDDEEDETKWAALYCFF
jgi:hypothetical protein